jgi:hypothetical protein
LSLHLTRQANLDALGLDDRINTGRLNQPIDGDPLLDTCQALSEAIYDWWDGAPPPLVYRTRTVPSARSLAFTNSVTWEVTAAAPLRRATGLLAALVARHGFTVPMHWLGPAR